MQAYKMVLRKASAACSVAGRQQVQHGIAAISLGTLGTNDTISVALTIDGSRDQGIFLKKMKAGFQLNGLTTDDGPLLVGLALAMSAAEVEEALEADPQGVDDVPASEQANRKVFPIGFFTQGKDPVDADLIPLRRVKFPWKEISEGQNLFMFVHNYGGNMTTGAAVTMIWTAVQEWLRD